MEQFISFKSEINNPWFNPWFILLHTHSNVCATVEGRCLEYLVCIILGRQWKSSRAGQQNNFFILQPDFNISCCIVVWLHQTFWFKLNFLLPKNESVLKILCFMNQSLPSNFVNWFHLQKRKSYWQHKMTDWILAPMQQNMYYFSKNKKQWSQNLICMKKSLV